MASSEIKTGLVRDPIQYHLCPCLLYSYSRFGYSRINMFAEDKLWIVAVVSILALLGVFIA